MQVPGAEVTVYRVQDPVRPDDSPDFEEGVLDAPVVTREVSSLTDASCISSAILLQALDVSSTLLPLPLEARQQFLITL